MKTHLFCCFFFVCVLFFSRRAHLPYYTLTKLLKQILLLLKTLAGKQPIVKLVGTQQYSYACRVFYNASYTKLPKSFKIITVGKLSRWCPSRHPSAELNSEIDNVMLMMILKMHHVQRKIIDLTIKNLC